MPKARKHITKQQNLKREMAKLVVPPLTAQVFWQIFWHYWGQHILEHLPILILRCIFVAVTCILVFWAVWQISGILLAHKFSNRKRRLQLVFSLIFVAIIAGTSPLYVGQIQGTQTRPKLRVDFDSPSTYTYTTNSTGEIKLRIVNRGEGVAYQYYAIVFAALENRLQKVIRLEQEFGTNCIDPGEGRYCNVHIDFTDRPGGVCYVYYKLIYSNSDTGGHLYTNDSPYWFSCDFTNPENSFPELNPAQRDIFKAGIESYYPDEDIE